MLRAATATAIALLVALFAAAPAPASTLDVHADYLDNGVIDRDHRPEHLRAALDAAEGDAQYAGLADAVTEALENRLLGTAVSAPAEEPEQQTGGLGVLPSPRTVQDSGGPPWPLLGLAGVGALLVMSGAGSTVYRLTHRRR